MVPTKPFLPAVCRRTAGFIQAVRSNASYDTEAQGPGAEPALFHFSYEAGSNLQLPGGPKSSISFLLSDFGTILIAVVELMYCAGMPQETLRFVLSEVNNTVILRLYFPLSSRATRTGELFVLELRFMSALLGARQRPLRLPTQQNRTPRSRGRLGAHGEPRDNITVARRPVIYRPARSNWAQPSRQACRSACAGRRMAPLRNQASRPY